MSPEPARIAIVGNLNVDQVVRTVIRFPAWDEELIVDSVHLELAGTAGYLAAAALTATTALPAAAQVVMPYLCVHDSVAALAFYRDASRMG